MKPLSWPKPTIPLSDCKDRGLYRITSRNLRLGVFRQETGGFVGIRLKFDRRYLFEEYHWDTGEPHGTVKPIELLPDEVPSEIEIFADRLLPGPRDEEWLDFNPRLFAWLEEMEGKYLNSTGRGV